MKSCDMGASKLRERVKLQRKNTQPDGAGGLLVEWVTYAEVRAFVAPVSSRERMFSERIEPVITHRIVIRYRDDIDAADRIVWRGHEMRIEPPRNIEARDRWLEFDAEMGVAVFADGFETVQLTADGSTVTADEEDVIVYA